MGDGDHTADAQANTFKHWWPKMKKGGLYIIEDIFTIPYSKRNNNCGATCYLPQCPADHPFVDAKKQSAYMQQELRDRDWFFTITGVHEGGGLDMVMVIQK